METRTEQDIVLALICSAAEAAGYMRQGSFIEKRISAQLDAAIKNFLDYRDKMNDDTK